MSEPKTVFVKRGEVLKITCLEHMTTGNSHFVVTNDRGQVISANVIKVGETIFSCNEEERTFNKTSLDYLVYSHIADLRVEDEQFMFVRDIAKSLNDTEDDFDRRFTISSRAVSGVCKELGFELVRGKTGFGIWVNRNNLEKIQAKFVS